MRVLANAETSAWNLLNEKVAQGQMTERDSVRIFNWGFRTATATIANWRHRSTDTDIIDTAIQRKMQTAKLRIAQARTQNGKNLAARELILAQMFDAVWRGMQKDVAVYQRQR